MKFKKRTCCKPAFDSHNLIEGRGSSGRALFFHFPRRKSPLLLIYNQRPKAAGPDVNDDTWMASNGASNGESRIDMESVEFICGRCGGKGQSKVKASGKAHYPRNWKPYDGVLTCEQCRRQNYHTITLSWRVKRCVETHNVSNNAVIVELLNKHGKVYIRKLDLKDAPPDNSPQLTQWAAKQLKVELSKVRNARHGFDVIRFLEPLWLEVKQAADLAVVELLRQEDLPIRDGNFGLLDQTKVVEKLKAVFPLLPKHAVDAMMLRIMLEYRKRRYDVLVRGDHSTLTYKYGYPILIRKGKWFPRPPTEGMSAQRLEVVLGKEEGCIKKGKHSNQRLILELCGGRGYSRYITTFKKLLTGEAVGGELALKGVKPAGLPRSATELYVNLRLELPVAKTKGAHGSLYVATDDKSFLYARVNDRKLWRINGDQLPKQFRALATTLQKVPGWIERHDERLQRLADDLKFENGTQRANSEAIAVVRERFVERQRNRLENFVETVTAAVADYAHRRRFAQIVYNDRRRNSFGGAHFPWSKLELRLRQKAEAHGLKFIKDDDEKNLP